MDYENEIMAILDRERKTLERVIEQRQRIDVLENKIASVVAALTCDLHRRLKETFLNTAELQGRMADREFKGQGGDPA